MPYNYIIMLYKHAYNALHTGPSHKGLPNKLYCPVKGGNYLWSHQRTNTAQFTRYKQTSHIRTEVSQQNNRQHSSMCSLLHSYNIYSNLLNTLIAFTKSIFPFCQWYCIMLSWGEQLKLWVGGMCFTTNDWQGFPAYSSAQVMAFVANPCERVRIY